MSDTRTNPLPEDWKKMRLDMCCSFLSGGTPSKSDPSNWNGTIPWASPKDLKRPTLKDTQDHITEVGMRSGSTLAPAGACFVVIRGMILARDVPVARAAVSMAFNQDLKAIIAGEPLHPDFLLYALQASKPHLIHKIGRSAHGTRTLLSDDLASLEISVPPKDEQRAISVLLSLVQSAIEVETRLLNTSRELKDAAMRELFTRGLRAEPQMETEIGPVPASWSVVNFASVREWLQYGTSTRCSVDPSSYPVLRIPNIESGRVKATDLKYCDLPREEADRYLLAEGDLLFIRTNGVLDRLGSCAVYAGHPERALFASYLIRARVKSHVSPRYLAYFFGSAGGTALIAGRATPAADGKYNLNTATIDSLPVPLPSTPEEQQEIVAILDAIDRKIDVHRRKRAVLEELFNALLHKLMTGEIRVSDLDLPALDGVALEAGNTE